MMFKEIKLAVIDNDIFTSGHLEISLRCLNPRIPKVVLELYCPPYDRRMIVAHPDVFSNRTISILGGYFYVETKEQFEKIMHQLSLGADSQDTDLSLNQRRLFDQKYFKNQLPTCTDPEQPVRWLYSDHRDTFYNLEGFTRAGDPLGAAIPIVWETKKILQLLAPLIADFLSLKKQRLSADDLALIESIPILCSCYDNFLGHGSFTFYRSPTET